MDAAVDIAARISGATTDVATRMTSAIRDAAKVTGAGFEYMLNTAVRESNLDPSAKAKSSSATGLFQFIDQTWLSTMKEAGGKLGYGQYADAITKNSSGRYTVNDPQMRQQIMALRKDPTANALMGGALANSNSKVLTDRLGRKPTDGELYMAHFLGASGAARFISTAEQKPNAKAADYFPRAAQANSSIFYDKQGGAKTLKQVYAGLVSRHNVIGTTAVASATPAMQGAQATQDTKQVAAAAPVPAAPLSFFRDIPDATSVKTVSFTRPPADIPAATATAAPSAPAAPVGTPALAAIAQATDTPSANTRSPNEIVASAFASDVPQPKFQSLYQSDENGPVSPMVRELWGTRRSAPAASTDTSTAVAPTADTDGTQSSAPSLNAPLDLFQFLRATARRSS